MGDSFMLLLFGLFISFVDPGEDGEPPSSPDGSRRKNGVEILNSPRWQAQVLCRQGRTMFDRQRPPRLNQ
jgi:hypothetical protein